MPGSLQEKIALVTGAGSGIVRACAVVMTREGATVAVSDHDGSGAEETLRAIKDVGGDGGLAVEVGYPGNGKSKQIWTDGCGRSIELETGAVKVWG